MSGARHAVGGGFRATDDIGGEIADDQPTQANGVHVFFDESTGATFKESDIATLTRTNAQTITFAIDFTAATNKAVKITIDG